MAELQFENRIIKNLEDKGWTFNKSLSNQKYEALYDHWREILNRNNRTQLNGEELSDSEFDYLKAELNKINTPYDAQLALTGAGNVGSLPLVRDDGTQMYIKIFWGDEVAGGHSEYEVVNQITFDELNSLDKSNRRIDILLLINGLPIAHIEEKDEHIQSVFRASNQLKKYAQAGMYTGLMSFVQVQFIMSQHDAKYFARPKSPEFYQPEFQFNWQDKEGNDVTDAFDFVEQVMYIPGLHRLVTTNIIPDESDKRIMVMRPYQIHATRAIMDRMREMDENNKVDQEGGYVWHTTGSGKTVTSFKVAQLLASTPEVKNVLFVVDRVDLIEQTYNNFLYYAYETFKDRIKKPSGRELKKILSKKSDKANIFLITIQGLSEIIDDKNPVSTERMVILMDEAHRSANGDSVIGIKKALPKSTWFGFTGTPNFYSDEVNEVKTTRTASTADVFGKRLHTYTIKDAIGDNNVLGFDVTQFAAEAEKNADTSLDEYELEQAVYNSPKYKKEVVLDILNHWDENHSGPVNGGEREKNVFHGMLAVSGKQAVVDYYKLFRELAPDLHVAMTFSKTDDNGDNSLGLQTSLLEGIKEYQELFDTQNFLESKNRERDYLKDITARLSHRINIDEDDGQARRLDLVIVSDQLLTGFDSKYVNTIYFDKILREGLLIQAMSRTNRILDTDSKPAGQVRFYRKGEMMKRLMDQALIIYTKGGYDTLDDATKSGENPPDKKELDGILIPERSEQIKELIDPIYRLRELTGGDFSQTPKSERDREEFYRMATSVNSKVRILMHGDMYFGKEVEIIENGEPTGETITLPISKDEFGAIRSRINDVIRLMPKQLGLDLSDVTIEIKTVGHEIINFDSLVDLLNGYIDNQTEENRNAIEKHIIPLEERDKQDVRNVVDGIKAKKYTKHFDSNSLDEAIKYERDNKIHFELLKWGEQNNFLGNDVVRAYEKFEPGEILNNNHELDAILKEMMKSKSMPFGQRQQFTDDILNFFSQLH